MFLKKILANHLHSLYELSGTPALTIIVKSSQFLFIMQNGIFKQRFVLARLIQNSKICVTNFHLRVSQCWKNYFKISEFSRVIQTVETLFASLELHFVNFDHYKAKANTAKPKCHKHNKLLTHLFFEPKIYCIYVASLIKRKTNGLS